MKGRVKKINYKPVDSLNPPYNYAKLMKKIV